MPGFITAVFTQLNLAKQTQKHYYARFRIYTLTALG